MDIKDIQGNIILSVSVSRECEHVEELMKSDYIQLSWNSSSRDILPAGSYIEYKGEKYSLLEPYSPTQKDELEFTYQPQFQSKIMIWGKTPFFMYTYADDTISNREPDWSLTDNPANFMSVVVDAIKNETGETWTYSVGDSLPASTSLSFQTTDIFSALNQIANAFETEWWVDKINKVIHLSKASHGETVALEVGNNVKTPSVTYGKEGYYTRFYAFGSTRNIVQDYKGSNVNNLVNKRLTLDPDKYPGGYKDIRDNLSSDEIFSKVLIFDDIYPSSQLKISDVRMRLMWTLDSEGNKVQVGTNEEGAPIYDQYAIWYFQIPDFIFDNTIYDKDANPQGMLISGKKLSVHFQDGPLSGREFELNYHDKSEAVSSADGTPIQIKEGDYEILFVKEDSLVIPMINNLVPVDGNEIILFNIRMPEEYTASAYLELEATLSREMERMSSDLNNYQFSSNPIAFKEYNPNLSLGRNVTYKNGNYSYPTRVIKLVTKLDFEIEQTITVGNEQIKGNTQEIKEEVASANEDINLLAILNSTTNSLTQAYNRTQQLMLEGFASIKDMWKFDPNNADTIYSKYNVYSEKALSAKGLALGSGGGSGEGGATALYQLNDVAKNASETGVLGAGPGKVLTYGTDGKWYAADAVGLDETALGKYLTDNNYAKKSDIPSLSGYATQSWVLGKNYITSDALSGYATQSWVNSQGYATASSLKAVSDKLNDFLEGSDTDGIINKWKELEAFLAGQMQTSTLADLLAVKADKATTLSGYGITDAYTKTEVNTKLGSYVTTTALNTALAKKVDVAFLAKVFGFIGEDSSEVSINDMGSVITSIKAKFGLWTDEYLSSKGLNPNAGGGSGEGATALYQLNDVSQNASGTGVLGAETGKVLTYGSDGKWYAAKAGMDEDALSSYLTENNYAQKSDIPSLNGYATQSWVNTALEKKVDKVSGMGLSHNDFTDTLLQKLNGIAEGANKYILPIAKAAVLGGVMIGSTLTASATGVLDLPEVAVAGTYAKVTTDVYGRVTAGSSLSASDIPALGISKITGLQAALDDKVNKADFVTEFDKAMQRWFVRDTANKGLHPADYDSEAVGIYSDSYMSAKGVNTGAGGSAGGASSLGELNNVGSWADDIPTVDRIMVQRKGATHWESLNLSDIGLNETQLSDYLTTNNYAKKSDIPSLSGYATQAWVNTKLADYATTSSVTTLLAEKVDKVEGKGLSANDFTDTLLNKLNGIEAGANKYVLPTASGSVLGGVKVGTTLSIANGVLNLKSGIATAGTYTKVTVDTYGRITAGTTLIASDIPTLAISKITGLQNALDQKMDISDFQSKFNAAIASWFVRDTENKGIRPADHNSEPVGFYTNSYISSKGINTGSGGGISDYDRLDSWDDYSTDKSGYVLSAGLGWDLNTRVSSLESKAITLTTSGTGNGLSGFTQNGNTVTFSKATFLTEHQSLAGYATESWVNNKGYLVATSADKANWNTAFGWGDHSKAGYATQLWVTSKDYATIADLDARINALVNGAPEAFDTLKEIADVLQGNVNQIEDLLTAIGTKADKTITISAGTGLNGGGTLAANRTINLSAATTKALGGIIVGDRLSIDSDGKLSATYTYTLPTASASVLGGVKVGTTLAISSGVLNLKAVGTAGTYFKTTTDAYGRVTAGSNPTTLAGFGITDGVNDVAYSGSGNAVTSATVSGHIITLVKGTTFLTKATFDDLFEKVNIGTASAPVYAIKAKYGLYTEQFLSSMGLNLGTGSGGGSDYDRLDTWADYDASKAGWVLSAGLGNDLNTRVTSLENGAAVTVTPSGSGTVVKDVTKNGTVITVTKGDLAFGSLTGKPTTIAGYGITNAYTKTESDGKYPLKAGTGATGTWSIDVTGYSKRLYANQDNAVANTLMQGSGLYYNQVSSTTDTGYPSNYGHTIRWQRSTSSTLSSSQAVVDLFHATGASALNQLYLRTGYGDGSKMVWGSFVQLLHTGNYTSLITKLGTTTVGSNTKFFYLNAGTPTASTATVGSSSLPVYMNAGTITQCSTTLGVSITGTAPRLTTTELTNQDLNSYTYTNYSGKLYYAGGGNTTTNVPSGVGAYGLMVWRIATGYTGHLMLDSAGDFRARFNNGTTWSAWDKLAYITDNVASATKLQTARTINGTSFDGTANITTAKWGTARTLAIAAASKSIDGSTNITISRADMNVSAGDESIFTGTTVANTWYRIASSPANISSITGIFSIYASASGYHTNCLLTVSTSYGNTASTSIQQLSCAHYGNPLITQARIVYHTSYSGNYAYLEVLVPTAIASTFVVRFTLPGQSFWNLNTSLVAGSIPSGYTSKTITLKNSCIVANVTGDLTGNVTGNLTGNASTATSLQTARTLWGQSFNGTANITGTLLGVESVIAKSGRFNNFLAYYDTSTSAVTGTICITLPNGWTSSMNTYEILIYEYNTTANASVITIGGYNYNGGGTASSAKWVNIGYHTKGSYSKGVRLGYNGSKCVILLGTTATTWYYPKVYLKAVYTGFDSQTIWGGTYSISVLTSETGYTNIDTPARMDEFFGDTSVTGRLAVTGAGHFGYTYTTMTAGINVKGDSATTGISIYDGTGTTARLYRKGDILYITRAGNDASGILMSTAGSIYPGANNTLTNGTTTNRWSGVYTQLLNVAGLATTSRILASGEIQSTSAKAFRAIYGSYGFFMYNDGNSSYFMLTAKDDQYGTYNSLRPLYINNSTGVVTMGNGTNIGGILNVTNTTDATTTTAAAIKTAGGLAVAKQLRVGGAATLSSSLYVTGSATFMGGIRIGDYWLRSTADGLELSHATSGKTAGLYATGFLSSMGLNPGTGEGGSGSDYDRLDAWDDYSADKAGYVLSAKLGNDLNTRVKSLEGGSALTVTTTGSGNAVTSVAKSGTAITVTKGTTFVDTTNAQTIGGTKTFSSSIRMGQSSLHYLNNASANNATGLYWKTASYAANQFGIGCFTANNASPRGFIGWTSEPWTTSNNLTVSETQLTYKAKNILHAGNYNDYAPTKTGGGASGTWGISITGNAATATTASRLTNLGGVNWTTLADATGNGIRDYVDTTTEGRWMTYGSVLQISNVNNPDPGTSNHWLTQILSSTNNLLGVRWRTNTSAWSSVQTIVTSSNYTSYVTKIGTATIGAANKGIYLNAGTPTAMSSTVGSTSLPVYLNAGAVTVCSTTLGVSVTGNAATATALQTSRTIFGKSFNGSANVAGQALVYGTYQETASSRYSNGGIQVRENGMVGNAQTDDGYAPAIGFHWANRIGASLILTTSGFKFMNQAFTGYQNVYGIFKGNADSATQVYNTETNPTSGTWYNGTFITSSTNGNKAIRSNDGFKYYTLEGTASAQGEAMLQLGTPTATGTAGNKRGRLVLYSSSSGYGIFVMTTTTGAYTFTFPAATGTVALTSSNVASATKLQTARTLWGQSFNGTANVSGSMTGIGPNIVAAANITMTTTGEGNNLSLKYNNDDTKSVVLNTSAFKPFDLATNKLNLGTSAARWLGVYANTGNFSSTVTGTRLISTVATGTAPLTVSSTTMVTNLNAQMVGGIGVSNIPLEYDANYKPTGTTARWIRIAYFDYSSASYSWSGTFAITNTYTNDENKGLIFTVSTSHGTTSPVITQIGGASGVFTSIRIVKDTTTVYPTTAKVYLEVYYNSTSAANNVYVSYKPANRAIGKWTLYTTYTAGSIPTGHTAIAQLYTTSGLSTTANLRVQGTAVILGATNHNDRLDIQSDGKIVPHSTATRRSGVYGVYDSTKIGHIWSMGTNYMIADDGSGFGNLYGFAYQYSSSLRAIGHQAVWCVNGNPRVAIGDNFWVANNATISAALYTDTLTIKNTEAVAHLKFSRGSYNYITAPASGNITFVVGGQAVGSATAELTIQNGSLIPGTTNATSLGSSSLRWSNTYTQLLNVAGVATLSSTVNIAGVLNANNATDATSTTAAGAVFDGGVGIAKQLRVGGNVTIGGNVTFASTGLLSVPYSGGQWISLATRTNLIAGNQNTSEAGAHGLFRVKSFAGDAVVFGGLKNAIGFYGFYKARIDSGDNGSDWATTWNTTTGALTHNKAMTVSGATTLNSTLTVASTGLFNLTTDATSTTAAAVRIVGGLAVGKQLRVGGAATLSSTLAVTSTSTFTGKTTHNGGIGATTGTFSSTLSAAGVVSFTNATDATSTTAAAVKITGGLGIAKQLRVGGASTFSGTINTSVATFINLGANATDQKILKDVDGNGFYSGISFFGTKGSNMGVSDIMMNIYAGGAIQIHSQAGSGQILLNGTVHNNVGMYSDGYMSSKGLNDTSDMRLKNKGRDIFLSVKDIAHAPAFEYTWKDGTPGVMVGSSAQYWQKVLPPSVKKNKDGYLSLFSGHLAMVGMISLARHHEDLERMVKGLKKEIKEKDKRIEELEKIVRQLFVA